MSASTPHRAGLGFPEAVIIRSDPGPSTHPCRPRHYESENDAGEPSSFPASLFRTVHSATPAKWDSLAAWREWNVNSTNHGPEGSRGPPVFLPSQAVYDELGRSTIDGVGVEVDQGRRRRNGDVEDGQSLASWYKALSEGHANPSSSLADPPRALAVATKASRAPSFRYITEVTPPPTQAEPSGQTEPHNQPNPPPAAATPIPKSQSNPLRIHSKEWFIRRALLASHKTALPSVHRAIPSSISTLLHTAPPRPRVAQHRYALGPENKGYELLRDRLGWEGGGLGRPAGWREALEGQARLMRENGPGAGAAPGGEAKYLEVVEVDPHGNNVIDLTADSDLEDSLDGDLDVPPEAIPGPGRTVPIATTLKLDRLGLGHRRAQPRDNVESTKKKVTHTAEEIAEAQRRAWYAPRGGVELGKKGKVRWKERARKDREQRLRIAAALR